MDNEFEFEHAIDDVVNWWRRWRKKEQEGA